jgi:hypothetical protein
MLRLGHILRSARMIVADNSAAQPLLGVRAEGPALPAAGCSSQLPTVHTNVRWLGLACWLAPDILERLRAHCGVANRIRDRGMAQVVLQPPRIHPLIRQCKAS